MSVPANVMKMLDSGQKRNIQDIVIEYLISEEGAVILTEKEEQYLERVNKIDELIRMRTYSTQELINLVKKQYGISLATASRLIDDTKYIFGSIRKSNKKYLLALHLDRLEEYAEDLKSQGEHELVIKLYSEITKAIKELPQDKPQNIAPAAILFNISQNNVTLISAQPLTETQAEDIAKKKLADKGVVIDFEEE